MARRLTTPLGTGARSVSRRHATADQRAKFEIGRFGIHWPEIDEDLNLADLLLGAKAPGATRRGEGWG